MVFEGIIAEVIDRFLGSFLQEVTKKQLNIGLLNGNVVLKNIEVKPEAFKAFDLPLSVNRGVVGRLTVKVPWTQLKSESVVVHLQDIYILASSSSSTSYSSSDDDSSYHSDDESLGSESSSNIYDSSSDKFLKFLKLDKKQKNKEKENISSNNDTLDSGLDQLSEADIPDNISINDGGEDNQLSEKSSNKKSKKGDSFKEKLISKIINNLQVVIEKVHIRIEERRNNRNIAIGLCLDKLFVQSTDDFWNPTWIESSSSSSPDAIIVLNKLANLSNLSIYCDHDQEPMSNLSTKDLSQALRDSIPTSKDPLNHHMLLHPLSANLRLKIHQVGSILQNITRIDIESIIDEIGLSMEPQQYNSLLSILENISEFVNEIKEDKQNNKSTFESIIKKSFINKEKSEKEKEKEKEKLDREKEKEKEKLEKEKEKLEKEKEKSEKEKDKLKKAEKERIKIEEKKKKEKEKEEKKKKKKKGVIDFEVELPRNSSTDSLSKSNPEALQQQVYDTIGYKPPTSSNSSVKDSTSSLGPPSLSSTSTTISPPVRSKSSRQLQAQQQRELAMNFTIKTIHVRLLSDKPEEELDNGQTPLIYGDISGIQLSLFKKANDMQLDTQVKSIKLSGLWVQNEQFPDMISSSTLSENWLNFQMSMSPIIDPSSISLSPQTAATGKKKRLPQPPKNISIMIDVKPFFFVLNSAALLRYLQLITPSHTIDLSGLISSKKKTSVSKNKVNMSIISQSPTVIIPISSIEQMNNDSGNSNSNNSNNIKSSKKSNSSTNGIAQENSVLILDFGKISLEMLPPSIEPSSEIDTSAVEYQNFQITTMNIKTILTKPPALNTSTTSTTTARNPLTHPSFKEDNRIENYCNQRTEFDKTFFETSLIVHMKKRKNNQPDYDHPKVIMKVNFPFFRIYFSPYSFYQLRLFIFQLMVEIRRVEDAFIQSFQFKLQKNGSSTKQQQLTSPNKSTNTSNSSIPTITTTNTNNNSTNPPNSLNSTSSPKPKRQWLSTSTNTLRTSFNNLLHHTNNHNHNNNSTDSNNNNKSSDNDEFKEILALKKRDIVFSSYVVFDDINIIVTNLLNLSSTDNKPLLHIRSNQLISNLKVEKSNQQDTTVIGDYKFSDMNIYKAKDDGDENFTDQDIVVSSDISKFKTSIPGFNPIYQSILHGTIYHNKQMIPTYEKLSKVVINLGLTYCNFTPQILGNCIEVIQMIVLVNRKVMQSVQSSPLDLLKKRSIRTGLNKVLILISVKGIKSVLILPPPPISLDNYQSTTTSSETNIARLDMKEVDLEITKLNDRLILDFFVEGFELFDIITQLGQQQEHLYRKVLSNFDDSNLLLSFKYERIRKLESGPLTILEADVNRFQIYLLPTFLNILKDYILDLFQFIPGIIKSGGNGGNGGNGGSKGNSIEKYRKRKKLKINAVMESPYIIIPENEISKNQLVLDLGKLSISNEFINNQTLALYKFNLDNLNIKTIYYSYNDDQVLKEVLENNILTDLNLSIQMTSVLVWIDDDQANANILPPPRLSLNIVLGDLFFRINQKDVLFLMNRMLSLVGIMKSVKVEMANLKKKKNTVVKMPSPKLSLMSPLRKSTSSPFKRFIPTKVNEDSSTGFKAALPKNLLKKQLESHFQQHILEQQQKQQEYLDQQADDQEVIKSPSLNWLNRMKLKLNLNIGAIRLYMEEIGSLFFIKDTLFKSDIGFNGYKNTIVSIGKLYLFFNQSFQLSPLLSTESITNDPNTYEQVISLKDNSVINTLEVKFSTISNITSEQVYNQSLFKHKPVSSKDFVHPFDSELNFTLRQIQITLSLKFLSSILEFATPIINHVFEQKKLKLQQQQTLNQQDVNQLKLSTPIIMTPLSLSTSTLNEPINNSSNSIKSSDGSSNFNNTMAPIIGNRQQPQVNRILKKENSIVIPFMNHNNSSDKLNEDELSIIKSTPISNNSSSSSNNLPIKKQIKIKLIINIESPQIIITLSNDAILIDLGKVHIENLFYFKNIKQVELNYESMEIQLSNLFVDIVQTLDDTMIAEHHDLVFSDGYNDDCISRTHLLEDINFVVNIDIVDDFQALSKIQDVSDIPIQKVDIYCKSVSFQISLHGYQLLLNILINYMSIYKKYLEPILLAKKSNSGSNSNNNSKKNKKIIINDKVIEIKTEIYIQLTELRFSMLLNHGLEMEDQLATLQMNDLGSNIHIFGSAKTNIKCYLKSIRLSDSRVNSDSKFIDLFCSKNITTFEGPLRDSTTGFNDSSNEPLISATINLDKLLNRLDIDAKLDRPRIYISPTIVYMMGSFFLEPYSKVKDEIKLIFKKKSPVPISPNNNLEMIENGKKKKNIDLKANINKLKILLVENPNSEVSNLVIAKFSLDATFKETMAGSSRIIGGSIQNFQMFSFRHSIANVSSSRAASLLDPINLNFNCSLLLIKSTIPSEKSNLLIDVSASIDPVNLFLSYHDTLLLALIAGQLKKEFPKLSTGKKKNINKSPLEIEREKQLKRLEKKVNNVLNVKFDAPQFTITLVNDYMDQNLPVIDLSFYRIDFLMEGTIGDSLQINVDSKVLIDYFNINKMAFEPLIENWNFQLKLIKSYQGKGPATAIELKSDQFLNINATYGFAHSLLSTYHSIQYDLKTTLPIISGLFKSKSLEYSNFQLSSSFLSNTNNTSLSVINTTPPNNSILSNKQRIFSPYQRSANNSPLTILNVNGNEINSNDFSGDSGRDSPLFFNINNNNGGIGLSPEIILPISATSFVPQPNSNTLSSTSATINRIRSGSSSPNPLSSTISSPNILSNNNNITNNRLSLNASPLLQQQQQFLPQPLNINTPQQQPPKIKSPLLQTISIRKLTSSFHPYWIINKTGINLEYSIKVLGQKNLTSFYLENEQKHPIQIENSKALLSVKRNRDFKGFKDESLDQGPHITIKLSSNNKRINNNIINNNISSSSSSNPIPIGRVGYRQIKVGGKKLIFEVGWNEDGSKAITIRSNVLIKNTTKMNLEVKFISNNNNQNRDTVKILFPDEELPVPVQYINCGKYLSILPIGDGTEYKHQNSFSDIVPLEDNDIHSLYKILTCPKIIPKSSSSYFIQSPSYPPSLNSNNNNSFNNNSIKLVLLNSNYQTLNNLNSSNSQPKDFEAKLSNLIPHEINLRNDKDRLLRSTASLNLASTSQNNNKNNNDNNNNNNNNITTLNNINDQNIIKIVSPLIIENLLPCKISITLYDGDIPLESATLESCEEVPFYTQDPRVSVYIKLSGIPGFVGQRHLLVDCDKGTKPIIKSKIKLEDPNKVMKPLNIMIGNREEVEGIRKLSLYSVYWIINKTGLPMVFEKPNFIPLLNAMDKESSIPQMIARSKNSQKIEQQNRDGKNHHAKKDCAIDTMMILYSSDLLYIKVPNSEWSNIFSLETVGTNNGIIYCNASSSSSSSSSLSSSPLNSKKYNNSNNSNNDYREFNFRASISLGKNKLQRTKMVTINFQYILVNSSDKTILYRQEGQNYIESIESGESKPFHWPNRYAQKLIQIKFDDDNYDWSGSFAIDDLADLTIKMRNSSSKPYLARVDIRDENNTHTSIHIYNENSEFPPFRIENQTPRAIRFYQSGCNIIDTLQSNQSTNYIWDQLTGTKILKVEIWGSSSEVPASILNCNILKIKNFKPVKIGTNTVYSYMKVDGPTRVLVVSYEKPVDDSSAELANTMEKCKLDLQLSLPRIGVSLIDHHPKELIYLSLNDISVNFSLSNIFSRLELIITNMQIDNQLKNTDYPVLFYHVNNSNNSLQDPKPFLHFSFIKNEEKKGLKYFELLSLLIQEVNLMLDDSILASILEMVQLIKELDKNFKKHKEKNKLNYQQQQQQQSNNNQNQQQQQQQSLPNIQIINDDTNNIMLNSPMFINNNNNNENIEPLNIYDNYSNINQSLIAPTISTNELRNSSNINESTLKSTPSTNKKKKKSSMIYIKLLLLNPIKVILSFSFVRDGFVGHSNSDMIGVLLEVLGVSFGLDRTTICLNALILEHPFLSERSFANRIKTHYTMQSLNQLYKVLGSSDNIGNPVGLFNHLAAGVKDFFYEPALGLITSPKDFGKGLAKGSISLLKNSVYGLFNTLSKLSNTVGKGIAVLSFDDQYLRYRQRSRQKKAKHIGDGIAYGIRGLGRGIVEGVSGVVVKPYEGAVNNGVQGFAKGVVQGVVGVGVKPVVGVFDLATLTTEGIRNTTGLFKDTTRIRPPRCFGTDNLLVEYNYEQSEGRYILETTFKGKFKDTDSYIIHFHHGKNITLVTNNRIIHVKNNYSFKWSATFENIKSCEINNDGILLHFEHLQRIMVVDYRTQFTIPISDSLKDQKLQLHLLIKEKIQSKHY